MQHHTTEFQIADVVDAAAAAIGLASELEGYAPTVPDWALDQHTVEGRRRGRGLDHFLAEGAQLNPPAAPDQYAAEAARLWRLKAKRRPKDNEPGGDTEPRLL
jgi:hypothetical protein